jgi:hypothetical protein
VLDENAEVKVPGFVERAERVLSLRPVSSPVTVMGTFAVAVPLLVASIMDITKVSVPFAAPVLAEIFAFPSLNALHEVAVETGAVLISPCFSVR